MDHVYEAMMAAFEALKASGKTSQQVLAEAKEMERAGHSASADYHAALGRQLARIGR